MFKFNKKGLNCLALNTKASGRQEREYGKNAEITELYIEDVKYSQEGHLNQNQVEQWIDDILKDANTDPRLWQKDQDKIEYDRWGRMITDGWGNDFSHEY